MLWQETVARISGLMVARIANWMFKISRFETKNLVIEHELLGVTPEMIDWWWQNMSQTEHYKLWHPRDHIRAELEVREEGGKTIQIQHVMEKIGGIPTLLHLRFEDPHNLPIPIEYDHAFGGSGLDRSGRPYSYALHQYEEMPGGTRMRSTFILPAKAPKAFARALRKHNCEEMAQFPRFLPQLYKEKTL